MNEFLTEHGYKHWGTEGERIGKYEFIPDKYRKRVGCF